MPTYKHSGKRQGRTSGEEFPTIACLKSHPEKGDEEETGPNLGIDTDVAEDDAAGPCRRRQGRPTGYKMEDWKKQLQAEALKDRELTQFNEFFTRFIRFMENLSGERFWIRVESERRKKAPEDNVFVLESIVGAGEAQKTVFYFRNCRDSWNRLSLKSFDIYERFVVRHLYPVEPSAQSCINRMLYEYAVDNPRLHNRKHLLDWLEPTMAGSVDVVEAPGKKRASAVLKGV